MINIFRPIFSKNWEITSIWLHTADLKTKENPPSYTYSWNLTLVWGASKYITLKPQKNYVGYLSFYIWLESRKSIFLTLELFLS